MADATKQAQVVTELQQVLTRHGLAPAERLVVSISLVRDEATKTGMSAQEMIARGAAILSGKAL